MSEGNESALRFSLEESVWFRKGQEVSELISISLNPDITIHQDEQYVNIEGSLELIGEYRQHESESEEEIPFSPKFVQIVEHREEDVFEFIHQFPVDITIPVNRVKDIDEIEVTIDSFDYHLPERSCLKLVADLTIRGIYEEEGVDEEQQTPDVEREETGADFLRPFEVEINEITEPEKKEAADREVAARSEENENQQSEDDLFVPFSVTARKEPDKEPLFPPEDISAGPKASLIPIREEEPEQSSVLEEEKVSGEEKDFIFLSSRREKSATHNRQEDGFSPEYELYDEAIEEGSSDDDGTSSHEPEAKKKKKKKDGISLAEFFARKEEDDDVTRLKVCIVQQGETIEMIAERYDVTVQSILRVNDMDMNQDVYAGQVLYIPEQAVYK